jgi:hypothetical protein
MLRGGEAFGRGDAFRRALAHVLTTLVRASDACGASGLREATADHRPRRAQLRSVREARASTLARSGCELVRVAPYVWRRRRSASPSF